MPGFLRRIGAVKAKMTKFRVGYDKDKETKWLNRMAEQGWAMTGFFLGFYRFAKCEPGEYIYQMDIAESWFSVSDSYRQFMEEMGVEIVCIWGPWVLLRRRTVEGAFEMYTDVESTIAHYTKVRKVFQEAGAVEGGCMLCGMYYAVTQKTVVGWWIAVFAAVILLLFLKEIARLNGILTELNGRLGRKSSESDGALSAVLSGMRTGGFCIGIFLYPILYALLHELGHCIVVWLCGGTVTGFYPFGPNAHMTYEGITDSFSFAWIDIAGTVLPLVAVAAFFLLYKGSKKHSWLNIYLVIISGISILTVMPWIVLPIGQLFGLTASGDDVIHFIRNTGFHPAVVTLCAIVVFALMCFWLIRKIPRLLGRAAGRKFMITITALMTAVAVVAIVIQVIGLIFTADKVFAEGNIQYTAEGSGDSMLQEEFVIEIQQPGEYVFYAEWEVDRDGVIAAVVLRDEEEIYCQCTAGIFLKLESMPFHLDSGKATLSFYLLGCEEDWLEYCRITGADASDIEDFSWQPDEPSTVTGSYRLVYIKQ